MSVSCHQYRKHYCAYSDKCKKPPFITMCKAHSKVTHIKQQKYFSSRKGPWTRQGLLI